MKAVGPDVINTMETYIGLTPDQFNYVLRITLPSMSRIYKDKRSPLYISHETKNRPNKF